MQKRVKYWENVLNYAKSVKLRKFEKNTEEQPFRLIFKAFIQKLFCSFFSSRGRIMLPTIFQIKFIFCTQNTNPDRHYVT